MSYQVTIIHNPTGIQVTHETTGDWERGDGTADDYPWTDGNYSCDCNRLLFFFRAFGCDEGSRQPEGTCIGWGEFDVITPDGVRCSERPMHEWRGEAYRESEGA